MASLALTPPVFVILAALIEQRAGLHYAPEDRELLADKVSSRALEAGFESLLDYYYFLRYDPAGPAALDALIDALLVHETYFFRDRLPLEVLVEEILVPRVRAGQRLRVWCAACSTGEEPLTLAMMLADRGALEHVRLVASDLSQRVLDRARRGEYNLRSMRALPAGIEGRYLDVVEGRPRVRAELVAAVDWRRVNLVDAAAISEMGRFDAILCRNVLIYFQDDMARRVVDSLAQALAPGAPLLVGTSESLMRFGTALVCEELRGAFFYVRPKESP
ncbi:CheR family methyltransferase [Stigmatella aurantiaca]|uniref:protein-glutamate O-methyltransferase n=1 Tax=Stigmatella aurantiaca (strain DW4/3-1) TaxID=378806 RepID=Q091N1_STIAD|nr:protein-glutamate O-methyltransferase CheR [Stigmatella aurantiaca]ADO68668.1 Chemotaxis protein methyltransferase CheR [Stigmatella aurantiaca DW4/3-1]EAU66432.1 chemotaxis protein methyltransferase CheR [Stigmatella aurantiaca DW4/3-1]